MGKSPGLSGLKMNPYYAGVPKASLTRAVAHPVGGIEEGRKEAFTQGRVKTDVFHGPRHAAQPLIPFRRCNREIQMTSTQTRMPKAADVMVRAAHPAAQEPEEFIAGILERRGMQCA